MALFENFDLEDDNLMTAEARGGDEEPTEYGINFETGQLTGELVYGAEALAVWAWLALQTVRFSSMLYSDDYGCELQSLIGERHSPAYYQTLVRAMIVECVTQNKLITGIDKFSCEIEDTSIHAEFELVTAIGTETMEVTTDV